MGLNRFSWLFSLSCSFVLLFLVARSVEGSELTVNLLKAPLAFSPLNSATFVFEVLEGRNGYNCRNCSTKCKLDKQSSDCEIGEVSYMGLRDGNHTFEVCTNGSQEVACAGYNWIVDTIPPTADVIAAASFTNALNVSVNISFSEACNGGGGFGCSSVNSCNLFVYGAGQVIPSTFKILQPGLKFSLLVALSSSVQYGRVILVMDKNFCTDNAGNRFTRSTNSSFFIHYDRRSVFVNLRSHIPEKLLQLNSDTRTVSATNSYKNLRVYLYFSEPVLNSSAEILSSLRTSLGFLLPNKAKSLGNRRFGFLVKNLSSIAIVTINFEASFIISRYGTAVSPIAPVTFLYDTQRPFVRLSTTSTMRTKEHIVPVLIKFFKPVFGFNTSAISISGGHLQSFHEISGSIYTVDIHVEENIVSVVVPENITGDVSGNKNLPSNVLHVRHYSVPVISYVLSIFATASFAMTTLAAGLLSVSTASLQSIGAFSRPPSSLTSDPARNLFRMACHIQVFALSRWLAISLPVEYYEFTRGLQWSIPYFSLPWESGHLQPIMVDFSPPYMIHSDMSSYHESGTFGNMLSGNGNSEKSASVYGLPLTPMEYRSFFENQNIKPEAEFILDLQNTNGWREFHRNMFWLVVFAGSLTLVHVLVLFILKFKGKCSEKPRSYGALMLPRFEIFLIILALPCICQASSAIIKGGTASGVIVGIILFSVISSLLLALLLFLSVGITMHKLLQYKEVHQEGQQFHWYQDIVRATLGPGKKGEWTWKNQSNSVHLTMVGPLFEDLRGPPKYMLSQFSGGNPGKGGDRIIASDDETEDAEAPFIQKLFGILRIYYTFLELLKRVSLGVMAGYISANESFRIPTLTLLCITSFQLFFLLLKKPFIKKKVQLVEILSVSSEVVIFATCLVLLEKKFSLKCETRIGIFMVFLFFIGFSAQMINEWCALYRQILRLGPRKNSLSSGLKSAFTGLIIMLIPWNTEKWVPPDPCGDGGGGDNRTTTSEGRYRSSGSSSSSTDKPWLKQLRELAKASFSKDDSEITKDPSSSQMQSSGFWTRKGSGSSSVTSLPDFKTKSRALYKDLDAIFSSK